MKKKKLYLFLGIAIAAVVLISSIIAIKVNKTDSARFKKEYESLNGKKDENGNTLQKLKLPKKNKIKYISLKEALNVIKEESAIIFLGAANCNKSRNVIPIFLEKIEKSDVDEILYVDMTEERDLYKIENGKVEEKKSSSNEYLELLELLSEYSEDYILTDESGIDHQVGEKRLYTPLILAVKLGTIVDYHSGSVELREDQDEGDGLTDLQKSELEAAFDRIIDNMGS